MKITLRKADALQKVINGVLAETNLQTTATITRFNGAGEVVSEAQSKLTEAIDKRRKLIWALYELRRIVGEAGALHGVSRILARIACIDKLVVMLKPLAIAEPYLGNGALLAQQRDLIDDKTANNYSGRRESFNVSVILPAEVALYTNFLEDARKERLALSDELLEINVRTEFEVPDSLEQVLRKYGII